MDQPIRINAVAFPEGEVWVVQGIEYDICTHARNASDVPAAFFRAVVENACITEHLGRKPLEGIRPAPERFRAMFDEAVTELRPLRDLGTSNLPIAAIGIRLAGQR
jgi:hypothetical protein